MQLRQDKTVQDKKIIHFLFINRNKIPDCLTAVVPSSLTSISDFVFVRFAIPSRFDKVTDILLNDDK